MNDNIIKKPVVQSLSENEKLETKIIVERIIELIKIKHLQ